MKIGQVLTAAFAASILAAAGAIGIISVRQTSPVFSAMQLGRLAQTHAATIGAVFVVAFACLSFAIFLIAANADVARIRKQLMQISRLDQTEGLRNSLYSIFIATSLSAIARKLDDSLFQVPSGHARAYLPFHLSRAIRLEILRVYVQRLTAIEIAAVLLCAAYAALVVQFGLLAQLPDIGTLPWPNIAAAIAIVLLGSWLWIDDNIDSMASELAHLWHSGALEKSQAIDTLALDPKVFEPSTSTLWEALEHCLSRYSERIEVANETLYHRVAELVLAHQKTIDGLIGTRDIDLEDASRSSARLEDFTKSIDDLTRDVLPQLLRLGADQEKLHTAIQKRDSDVVQFNRRWNELAAKLDALELKLLPLGRLAANQEKMHAALEGRGHEVAEFDRFRTELGIKLDALGVTLLPKLDRLTTDGEKIQTVIQKRDDEAAAFDRRSAELANKLDAFEATLGRIVRLTTAGSVDLSTAANQDVKGRPSRSVAKDLEALLGELTKQPS